MAGTLDIIIREMVPEDYDAVYQLWTGIQGFGIRSLDDSREGVERFLRRNPTTSVVAVQNGQIIGDILCGHDGRTGYFKITVNRTVSGHHTVSRCFLCSHVEVCGSCCDVSADFYKTVVIKQSFYSFS